MYFNYKNSHSSPLILLFIALTGQRRILNTDTWNFEIYDNLERVKKILTGETYIHYSNWSIAQSWAYTHVLFFSVVVVKYRFLSLYICILLKKASLHCVHVFTDMAPICTVFQAPSRLTELSSAVMQVHRELLVRRHYLRESRARNELQAYWNSQNEEHQVTCAHIKTRGHSILCWVVRLWILWFIWWWSFPISA